MADPTHYIIPAPLLKATLEYLVKRPFAEVADAIRALTGLEPHEPQTVIGPSPEPGDTST